jgi:imidazolonepropionase
MSTLWHNARIACMTDDRPWGLIKRGAIITHDEKIVWVGTEAECPTELMQHVTAKHNLGKRLITPGLIDCHTHLVYGGDRAREFEQRLQGASYEEIARTGGGIRSTVLATRNASDETLFQTGCERACKLMAEGVTTLEIKSGYGLTQHDEARMLRVARRIGQALRITVRATYLAAHALPPEFDGRADDYIDAQNEWMTALHAEGLIDAVDAFCEHIGFTPAQTRRVFECARDLGLHIKLHAEQLSDQGGAALAAEFNALSCDHLEFLSDDGIKAMQKSGSVAVLLPGAFYFLRETKLPPVQALRDAGVPIAIATDHNPGSSPCLSPLLMLNMACTLFRLTPEEALRGMTVNAARALGLSVTHGTIEIGKRADFAVWDVQNPNELAYWFGHNPCSNIVIGGKVFTS